MRELKRIFLATEFWPPAQDALTESCLLARTFGAEVVLVHAVPIPTVPELGSQQQLRARSGRRPRPLRADPISPPSGRATWSSWAREAARGCGAGSAATRRAARAARRVPCSLLTIKTVDQGESGRLTEVEL